jgi:chromosome segregation ATPase
MALGGKALGNGWHDQAARFAGLHSMTKTKPARASAFGNDTAANEAELAQELEAASTRIAALERRLSQETTATQTLREHMQLLAKQFDDAELRATELETELVAVQDRAALHDNETESLQTSLDLATAENARLSQRLDLSDAALEDACAELARQQTACAKATGEHSKLAQEVFTANGKRLNETTELKDQLETMSTRALTAESLLADARECLQVRIAKDGATERSLAEMTAARRDADNQVKHVQDLLRIKQFQLNELEQSRQELLAAMNGLLKACQNRDTALTAAEDKIDTLTQRIAQLNVEARTATRRSAQLEAETSEATQRTAQLEAEACEASQRIAQLEAEASEATQRVARLEAEASEAGQRIAQLQAETQKANRRNTEINAQLRAAQRQRPVAPPVATETADEKSRVHWAALAVELAKLVKLKGQAGRSLTAPSPTALLANTIAF